MTRMTPRLIAGLVLGLAPCAALAQEGAELDTMIEAARSEPPLTVYAVTGKIVETAEAFSEAYGLSVEGQKLDEAGQVELFLREAQAGNVMGDVSVAADAAALMAQLVPQGMVGSWVPPDLEAGIAEGQRDPLVVVSDPHVWAYSTEAYDSCPVSNVWELTESKWRGRVAMLDPLVKPNYADWFNQLEAHHDDAMAAAYEAHFGQPFDASQGSATAAWVQAYASNGPLLGDSDTVANAVGAVGQAEPFFGIMSTAKFRANTSGETALAICEGMEPFTGWLYPGLAVIASGTDSPNAARLFVRYLLTEEGIRPQTVDGKISSNTALSPDPEEVSGVAGHLGELMVYDLSTAAEDFDRRQDWQDLWRSSYAR